MFHYKAKRLAKKGDKSSCPELDLNKKSSWEQAGKDIDERIELESRRCEYINPHNKHRCQRITKKQLPLCWQHTMLQLNLVIKPSKIGGLGLFACSPGSGKKAVFKRNEPIALYARQSGKSSIGLKPNGRFYTHKDLDERYGCATAPYAITVDEINNKNVDTVSQRSIASYANGTLTAEEANADVDWDESTVYLFATKPIYDGDEIRWYYGPDYQFESPKPLQVMAYHTGRSEKNIKCQGHRGSSSKRLRSVRRRSVSRSRRMRSNQ